MHMPEPNSTLPATGPQPEDQSPTNPANQAGTQGSTTTTSTDASSTTATPPTQQPLSQLSKPVPLSTTPVPAGNQIIPPPGITQPAGAASDTTQSADAVQEPSVEDSEEKETPLWRKLLGFLVSWIIIPAALVYLVHNFIFQAWYVDGQSMEPTFQNGNYLIVSKFEVSWKKLTGQANNLNVSRGDVVIFNPPDYPNDIYFIKRAIGLPGDRVVVKDGKVTIFNAANPNGVIIDEPYIGGIKLEGDGSWDIPPGSIFVLGDNRKPQASQDSRFFGPIPMKRFIGTASLRLLPVYEFGALQQPKYDSRLSPATNK